MHAVEIQRGGGRENGPPQQHLNHPNTLLQLFSEYYSSLCLLLSHTFSLNAKTNGKGVFIN